MSFGGLSFLGSGALAEGCPYPHLAQPLCHWMMHRNPPEGACTPSGESPHPCPSSQLHLGFTWGWLPTLCTCP